MNKDDFQVAFRLLSPVDQLLATEQLAWLSVLLIGGEDFFYKGYTIDKVEAMLNATDEQRQAALDRAADHDYVST